MKEELVSINDLVPGFSSFRCLFRITNTRQYCIRFSSFLLVVAVLVVVDDDGSDFGPVLTLYVVFLNVIAYPSIAFCNRMLKPPYQHSGRFKHQKADRLTGKSSMTTGCKTNTVIFPNSLFQELNE